EELGALVHDLAERGARVNRDLVDESPVLSELLGADVLLEVQVRRHERSAQHDLERALGDRENAELLADRLTLLGDLDAAAEGPGGERRERSVDRRTSASTDGATASVE